MVFNFSPPEQIVVGYDKKKTEIHWHDFFCLRKLVEIHSLENSFMWVCEFPKWREIMKKIPGGNNSILARHSLFVVILFFFLNKQVLTFVSQRFPVQCKSAGWSQRDWNRLSRCSVQSLLRVFNAGYASRWRGRKMSCPVPRLLKYLLSF